MKSKHLDKKLYFCVGCGQCMHEYCQKQEKLVVKDYKSINNTINPPKPEPTECELELQRLKVDIAKNLQIEMQVGEFEPSAIIFQGKRYVREDLSGGKR